MTFLEVFPQLLAVINLHQCLYGALGAALMARAYTERYECHGMEARERLIHGLIYICIGLAK
jgi:hypothetical protein